MRKIRFLSIAIILVAIYLLWTRQWDQATAFAVTIIMIIKLKEER